MLKLLGLWAILVAATTMEASGDALVRIGLLERSGALRVVPLVAGAVLLFGYGVAVNLTGLPFARVVGLYIATLFLAWQVVGFFSFRAIPSVPILVGGTLIVIGGLVVTFWPVAQTSVLPRP